MADDLNIREPADKLYVNTSEEWEMNWWSKKWGKTKQQIKDCVKSTGSNRTTDVARCLGVKA
jgi:hypothetical protein